MKNKQYPNKGFTLFEIIMTILVASIIIPPIVLMITTALMAPAVTSGTIKGNSLASDLMEEALAKKWDESSTGTGPVPDALRTAPANLGPETGETRASFDDIDDYNGYSETPPKTAAGVVIPGFEGYTRSVRVFYVQGGASKDYTTQLGTTSNFKKIIVSVQGPAAKNTVEAVAFNR